MHYVLAGSSTYELGVLVDSCTLIIDALVQRDCELPKASSFELYLNMNEIVTSLHTAKIFCPVVLRVYLT